MSISEAIASFARHAQSLRDVAEENKALSCVLLSSVVLALVDRATRAGSFSAAERQGP